MPLPGIHLYLEHVADELGHGSHRRKVPWCGKPKFLLERQLFVATAPRLLSTKDVTTSEDTEDEMEEGVTQKGVHNN